MEQRGRPTVTLVNIGFADDARSASSSKGMPGLRTVPENVPCECTITDEIEKGVAEVFEKIIAALTSPLTKDEENPQPMTLEDPSRLIFRGSLEEVNLFYYKRGWADGLPIIPPTEKAVADMLKGTDLPPDHVVGKLIPRLGKATVEKIAINAVMAGALPTYMPLLIAGVKVLMLKDVFFGTHGVSTGSWSPYWIINGPIRNDLNVNSGSGALSPGNIANAAIGRAMGLIIKNIGGIRKGIEDMGVQGNPCKYSMVLAENEEENPWEPLHVERGFEKEDSTISVFYPNSYNQTWPPGTDDIGILNALIYAIPKRGRVVISLTPPYAKTLFDNGWTKKAIAEYISEHALTPVNRLTSFQFGGKVSKEKENTPTGQGESFDSPELERIITDPDSITIVVAGGSGSWMSLSSGAGMGYRQTTMKVDLPENWDGLVKLYKNIVPKYAHY